MQVISFIRKHNLKKPSKDRQKRGPAPVLLGLFPLFLLVGANISRRMQMRIKFLVKGEEEFLCGLAYDGRTRELRVYGHRKRLDELQKVMDHFGPASTHVMIWEDDGSWRVKALVSPVSGMAWLAGLGKLKEKYGVEAVRSFRRLAR